MGNFRQDNRSNNRGGKRFDRRDSGRGFGGGNRGSRRGPVEMHKAVCAGCGDDCEVPFRPTGEKPVYCSDCFEKSDNSGRSQKRSGGRDFGRGRGSDRPTMHKVVCDKCGEDCEVPFKPSNDKPVYCSSCFETEGKNSGGGSSNKQVMEQINILNEKIDKLISILTPDFQEKVDKTAPKEELAKEKKEEKSAEKKTAKKVEDEKEKDKEKEKAKKNTPEKKTKKKVAKTKPAKKTKAKDK